MDEEEDRDWEIKEWKPASVWRRIKWKLEAFYNAIRAIPSFIKRMIDYAPLLWDDRDFDYNYLLTMLEFKLKRMREHITKHDFVESAPRIGKQIKYAEFLIQRIQNSDYYPEEEKALEEKWGKTVMRTAPCEDMPGCHYLDFTRTKCHTKEDREQEREATRALHAKQEATKQKDYERLFRHLNRYIQHWWD